VVIGLLDDVTTTTQRVKSGRHRGIEFFSDAVLGRKC